MFLKLFQRNINNLLHVRSCQMDVKLKEIFLTSVEAVKPKQIINLKFICDDQRREFIEIRGKLSDSLQIDITDKKIHIVGFGKGVIPLCEEISSFLGEKLQSGILSVPFNALKFHSLSDNERIQVFEGAALNLPDESAQKAAKLIRDKVSNLTNNDILFVLITGGGSSCLPIPVDPITLSEKSQLIAQLSRAGASINELNTVRIAISQVKGGKLAQIGKNAHRIVSFIISDIVGDPLHLIASGPTIEPCIQQQEKQLPRKILEKYNLFSSLSSSIYDVLASITSNEDTPTPIQKINNCRAILIANNRIAIDAAMEKAKELNFIPVFLSSEVQGDVVDVSRAFFDLAILLINFPNLPKQNFLEQIVQISRTLSAQSKFANDLVASLEACNSTRG